MAADGGMLPSEASAVSPPSGSRFTPPSGNTPPSTPGVTPPPPDSSMPQASKVSAASEPPGNRKLLRWW